MHYVYLRDIEHEHLLGSWQIRTITNKDADSIFASCKMLTFDENGILTLSPQKVQAKWRFVRHRKLIYNPQVIFKLSHTDVEAAIITKYSVYDDADLPATSLSLYFESGMETVLYKVAGG